MTSSPKQNAIVTFFIQIICVRIHWQVFLALGMLRKIPSQTDKYNARLMVHVVVRRQRKKTIVKSYTHKQSTMCDVCLHAQFLGCITSSESGLSLHTE